MSELVLIRGLPGSGKSSFAREIAGFMHFEADQYLQREMVHDLERDRLQCAHALCLKDAAAALQQGHKVVVSNTFVSLRELDPYLSLAEQTRIVECHGRYGSVHSVSNDLLLRMASRWESAHYIFSGIDVSRSPTAIEFWQEFAQKNEDVVEYGFVEYEAGPPLQVRMPLNAPEQAAIENAKCASDRLGVPFWDAMLTLALKEGLLGDALLDVATRSYPPKFEPLGLSRNELLTGGLQRRIDAVEKNKSVAMLSAVRMCTGEIRHVPMLDLRWAPDSKGIYVAWQIGRRLLPSGGVVVNSGRSLHLIGTAPVQQQQLIDVLTQALFFCPIVDRNYVAHHLRHKVCSLRVSAKSGLPAVALVY